MPARNKSGVFAVAFDLGGRRVTFYSWCCGIVELQCCNFMTSGVVEQLSMTTSCWRRQGDGVLTAGALWHHTCARLCV